MMRIANRTHPKFILPKTKPTKGKKRCLVDKVITVSYEFGSRGCELGVKLAERLGIPFHDKELISMAANDINIAEEAFQNCDEHVVIHDLLDRQHYHAFFDACKIPMSDQTFMAQFNAVYRLTAHNPYAIVGWYADMILGGSINLLTYSKMRDRIKCILILEPGSDEREMERRIREVDRRCKEYYQYYTGNTWGRAQDYHLCLDSGLTGVDGRLRTMLAYLGELSE